MLLELLEKSANSGSFFFQEKFLSKMNKQAKNINFY